MTRVCMRILGHLSKNGYGYYKVQGRLTAESSILPLRILAGSESATSVGRLDAGRCALREARSVLRCDKVQGQKVNGRKHIHPHPILRNYQYLNRHVLRLSARHNVHSIEYSTTKVPASHAEDSQPLQSALLREAPYLTLY